ELGNLDDPDALGLDRGILAAEVRQTVGEPGLGQGAQRAGFADTLRPFQDQRTVGLRARGVDPSYSRNQPAGTDGADVGRVGRTEIGGKPGVYARHAVPSQIVEILADRMEQMVSGN